MGAYLHGNGILIGESRGILNPIKIALEPLENSYGQFYTCGSFNSDSQGRIIPVGIKFSKDDDVTRRFYRALTNIALIAQECPHLASGLPLFYGLLIDHHNNQPRVIITEDFSGGGLNRVKDFGDGPTEGIPDEFYDLFEFHDYDEFKRMFFLVDGRKRIGDLDHVHVNERYKTKWDELREAIGLNGHQTTFTLPGINYFFLDPIEMGEWTAPLFVHSQLTNCCNI